MATYPAPEILEINYSYKKPDTDVWVLKIDDIPVDKSKIKDIQIVHLAPGSAGGNHKHPRVEWYIGLGDLVYIWLDSEGRKHEEHMNPEGKIRLIKSPSNIPHAVVNKSNKSIGVLYEMADGNSKDVKSVNVSG